MQVDSTTGTRRSEQATLLAQLRLDRKEEPIHNRKSRRVIWTSGVVVGVVAVLLVVWMQSTEGNETASHAQVSAETKIAQAPPVAVSQAALLDASGYVVARRQATVSSKITGKIVAVTIEEGQHVKTGEVIARLDDSTSRAALDQVRAEVEQARASLDALQIALEDSRSSFLRIERQVQVGAISQQAYDSEKAAMNAKKSSIAIGQRALEAAMARMELARRNLEDTVVRAPFSGLITEKSAQPGEVVSPVAGGGFTRTGIGTIVDMDSLEVEVDVSENYIDRVSQNQPVAIRLNAYPDWEMAGHVIATIPTADRAKATIRVRVAIDVRDSRIIPNMGARVAFKSAVATVAAL